MWAAGARRIGSYIRNGQIPIIIHLGDHDPSGIDMTRDIFERLDLFAGNPIDVERIALNFDQIGQYKPPPNPAKITDSRFNGYAGKYGEESWELDALSPKVLVSLIQDEIFSLLDEEKWGAFVEREKHEKKTLLAVADNYDLVMKTITEEGK